jgi:hypothetical protein
MIIFLKISSFFTGVVGPATYWIVNGVELFTQNTPNEFAGAAALTIFALLAAVLLMYKDKQLAEDVADELLD